jgi:hypothetical protein
MGRKKQKNKKQKTKQKNTPSNHATLPSRIPPGMTAAVDVATPPTTLIIMRPARLIQYGTPRYSIDWLTSRCSVRAQSSQSTVTVSCTEALTRPTISLAQRAHSGFVGGSLGSARDSFIGTPSVSQWASGSALLRL